ncbi:MAG: hypothetical protein K2M49_08500 [Muribaculaceae bacterium]|nr:hypothetical protein [Muribaculaceae bacterium]
MLHFLKLMLQILMAPSRGWEDVGADSVGARQLFRAGLLPLIGVAALTVSFGALFQLHPSAGALIVRSIVVIARYIIAYFCGVAVLEFALPKLAIEGLVDRNRVELFCVYCTGMMVIIGILENLLPMELTLLQFLPIYVVVVICMGRTFLDVDERHIFRFAACAIVGLILPVFIVDRLLAPAF